MEYQSPPSPRMVATRRVNARGLPRIEYQRCERKGADELMIHLEEPGTGVVETEHTPKRTKSRSQRRFNVKVTGRTISPSTGGT